MQDHQYRLLEIQVIEAFEQRQLSIVDREIYKMRINELFNAVVKDKKFQLSLLEPITISFLWGSMANSKEIPRLYPSFIDRMMDATIGEIVFDSEQLPAIFNALSKLKYYYPNLFVKKCSSVVVAMEEQLIQQAKNLQADGIAKIIASFVVLQSSYSASSLNQALEAIFDRALDPKLKPFFRQAVTLTMLVNGLGRMGMEVQVNSKCYQLIELSIELILDILKSSNSADETQYFTKENTRRVSWALSKWEGVFYNHEKYQTLISMLNDYGKYHFTQRFFRMNLAEAGDERRINFDATIQNK